jgi:hypothetical protein
MPKKSTGKPVKTSDEKLAAQIKAQSETVKTESKGTIINRWNAGTAITKSQYDEIKNQVEAGTVKEFQKQKAIIDTKTGEFQGYKMVTYFVNKQIVRIDNAIKADKLDDGAVANMSLIESANQADLEGKNISLHMQRSKLSSLKADFHRREVVRKTTAMEKLGLKVETLGEIYARAVEAKKLQEVDQADAETEATLVINA